MAFIIYSIASVTFVFVCLAMLWPINAARRRVKMEIQELRKAEDMRGSAACSDCAAPDGL